MGSTYTEWNQKATEWLKTRMGRRARIGLLAATVVSYPIGSILVNGPFVKLTFPKRYDVEELPPRLVSIAEEEYQRFLEKENRLVKDAVINRYIQKTHDDTVAAGSLGVRTGLCAAVPFYAKFRNFEDALEYFKNNHSTGFEYLGERIPAYWNDETSQELAGCYALSENAVRFLFLRDLYAHDGYASLAQRSISWTTWTTFSSIFTYWIHNSSKLFSGSAASFVVAYSVLLGAAWYANKQWHLLYRYLTDIHADAEASRATFHHAEGGKEYYWKMLKRNRLLRDLKPSLYLKITATGDVRGIATPIITRYDHLKDVNEEDDELKQVMSVAVGLAACAVSSLLFGSVFAPVKRCDPGNGIFAQWLMASSIFLVGLIVYAIEGFPKFEPLAMLGGMFWVLGNATAIPIINVIGIGMGMLVWGVTNCITGWAVGRFGLFGVDATIPSLPLLNYFGLILVIIGGCLFSQIRPNTNQQTADEHSPLMVQPDDDLSDLPDATPPPSFHETHRQKRRVLAIIVSLIAGIFYGVTFVPVIYIQNHPSLYPDAPLNGLGFVFSHYTGIFATASALLNGYVIISNNSPYIGRRLMGPSLLAGAMWAVAQSSWFVANDNLSQAVSFPIISMVPGVCAALWSVFYFREIEGHRNLRFLTIAILITLTGAVFVGISK
ncbi:unnamed protein product [Caenorhabditis bovis]|uniref:Transmembrane protein 144 n=1 Tax=Caenorhabditis bovis TaxID=2654633 RepID=A0A8S1EPB1_9PELO|nr:unnamed protein product [Caenorhabditis bovis]